MFLHNFFIFFIHIFFPKKYFVHKKEDKERKVGNIRQIRTIGNEGKTGIVRTTPNSFK